MHFDVSFESGIQVIVLQDASSDRYLCRRSALGPPSVKHYWSRWKPRVSRFRHNEKRRHSERAALTSVLVFTRRSAGDLSKFYRNFLICKSETFKMAPISRVISTVTLSHRPSGSI